ncbi:hypothetical protein BB561_003323 [Smittium simulii]|uniref:SH3 domain-containing protein n=1 Tax=Smittium simulii TaxID=133385 RepID=A0A2T9YM44_9FUNG|nr:hypothetical protein BB561_003323 [Smittium simulii]
MNINAKTLFLAKAISDYNNQKHDELELFSGDIVEVKETEFDSWWVGINQRTGTHGWFPANFVKKIEETPPARPRPKKAFRKALVLNDYAACEEDDLELHKGSIVEILEEFDSWFLGRDGAKVGTFPSSFVQVLSGEQLLKYQEITRRSFTPEIKTSVSSISAPALPYRSNSHAKSPVISNKENTEHQNLLPGQPHITSTAPDHLEYTGRTSLDSGSVEDNNDNKQSVSRNKTKSRFSRVFSGIKGKKTENASSTDSQNPTQNSNYKFLPLLIFSVPVS